MNTNIFTISNDAHVNYLATICRIDNMTKMENSDHLYLSVINGFNIIISDDFHIGDIVLYFPVETIICSKFLSKNNLYSINDYDLNDNYSEVDAIKDADPIKAKSMVGFFNRNGRVRILKLRGQYSQGFICRIEDLAKYDKSLKDIDYESWVGISFDEVNGEKFCWKYIPEEKKTLTPHKKVNRRNKKLKRFDRLVPEQFSYHYDTKQLGPAIHEINPNAIISITTKLHGTSAIFSNILTYRKLSLFEKIKNFFGFKVNKEEYGYVYSSRSVIKNRYITKKDPKSFYGQDIWGKVAEVINKYIPNGMTVYGEIVGYLDGSTTMIQKDHDYGCTVGCWKFMPYRITQIDENNDKTEWNVNLVYNWTIGLINNHPELKNRIMPLNILYYGPAKDLYKDIENSEHWHEDFLQRLKVDKNFYMELDEPLCKHKVPREGIVIRVEDDLFPRAWKLKTLRHYGKEAEQHDRGEVDIEEVS